MNWVNRFYDDWDSIYEFSIYAGNQRRWPHDLIRGPYSTEPEPPKLEPVNRDERLAKLAEDPEFKDIATKKQQYFKEKAEWRETDDGITEDHTLQVWCILDAFEEALAERPSIISNYFLAGDQFTLADVVATVLLNRCVQKRAMDMFKEKPHLTKYWERMQQRPSFKRAPIVTEKYESYFWNLAPESFTCL